MIYRHNRPRRLTAILAVCAVSSLAILGGTYAVYTDRDSSEQILTAGTVDIDIANDGVITPFTQAIPTIAPGDTAARYVTLKNAGNLGVTNLSLSQTNSGTPLITDQHGVKITVETCAEAWHAGLCSATHYSNLSNVPAKTWTDASYLNLPELAPTDSWYFKFTTALPAQAKNNLQANAAWLQYTFNGVQPSGKTFKPDGSSPVAINPSSINLHAVVDPSYDVKLNWTVPTGMVSSRLERSEASNFSNSTVIASPGLNSSFSDTTAEYNKTYYYRLVTIYEGGDEIESSVVKAVIPNLKLQWSDAGVISPDRATLKLSWAAIPKASTYVVKMGTTPGVYTETVYSGSAHETILNNSHPGSNVYFKVSATTVAGRPAATASDELTVGLPVQTMPVLSNFTSVVRSSGVVMDFTRNNDVDAALGYTLQYRKDGVSTWTDKSMPGLSTNLSLDASQAYDFRLKVKVTGGSFTYSPITTLTTSTLPPFELAVAAGSGAYNVTWKPGLSFTETYQLHRSTIDDFATYTPLPATMGSGAFVDTGANPNTIYYRIYSATVIGGRNVAYYSDPVSILNPFPNVAPPTLSRSVEHGGTVIDVAWSVPGEATSAAIYYQKASGGPSTKLWSGDAGAGSMAATGLTHLTNYVFTIYYYTGPNQTGASSSAESSLATGIDPATTSSVGSSVDSLSFNVTMPPGGISMEVRRVDSEEALGYKVVRTVTALTQTKIDDSGLNPATDYVYSIVATAPNGVTSVAAFADSTTAATINPWNTFLNGDTQGVVNWAAVPNATRYEVTKLASANTGAQAVVYTGPATSYTVNLIPGVKYTYSIKATNPGSATPSKILGLTATNWTLIAPIQGVVDVSNLEAVITPDSATMKITRTNAALGADAYKLIYRSGSDAWTTVAMPTNEYTIPLDITKAYEYKIEASSTDGAITTSAVKTSEAIPASTYSLAATSGNGAVALNWTQVLASNAKAIERSVNADFSSSTIVTTVSGVTTYTDASVTAGTTYYYRLLTSYTSGNAGVKHYSNAVTITATVPAVTLPSVTNVNGTSQTITWVVPAEAGSAVLARSTENGVPVVLWTGGSGSYSDTKTDLTGGTKYTYILTYYSGANQTGTSVAGSVDSYTMLDKGVLALSALSASSIQVNYTKPAGATSFIIQRSLTSNFASPTQLPIDVNATSFLDQGLLGYTLYYYRMIATGNNSSTSTSTAAAKQTLKPSITWLGTTYNAAGTQVTISWSAPSTVKYFSVYSGDQYGQNDSVRTFTSDTSITIPVGEPGTNVYYRILGYDTSLQSNTENNPVLMTSNPLQGSLTATITDVLIEYNGAYTYTIAPTSTVNGSYTYYYETKNTDGSWSARANGSSAPVVITLPMSAGSNIPESRYRFVPSNGAPNLIFTVPGIAVSSAIEASPSVTGNTSVTALNYTFLKTTGYTTLKLERSIYASFTTAVTTKILAPADLVTSPTNANYNYYVDSTVAPSTTYYYRLTAITVVGSLTISKRTETVDDMSPPAKPLMPTVSEVVNGSNVTMTWTVNKPTSVGAWSIDYSYQDGGPYTSFGWVNSLNNKVPVLTVPSSTLVYFRLRYWNYTTGNGNSSTLLFSRVSALDAPALSYNINTYPPTLNWTAANGATTLKIERSINGGSSWTSIVTNNTTASTMNSYVDTNVTPNSTYLYRLTVGNSTSSATSANLSATVPGLTITAPVLTADLVDGGDTTATYYPNPNATWTRNAGYAGTVTYKLKVGTAAGTYTSTAYEGTALTASNLAFVAPGSTAYYIVEGYDSGGVLLSTSPMATFSTPLSGSMTLNTVATMDNDNVIFTLTRSNDIVGASSYAFQYKLSTDTGWSTSANTVALSAVMSQLSVNVNYDFRIVAQASNGRTVRTEVDRMFVPPSTAVAIGSYVTVDGTAGAINPSNSITWTSELPAGTWTSVVERSTTATWASPVAVGNISTTSASGVFNDTSIVGSTMYYYRLKTTYTGNSSANTVITSLSTGGVLSAVPFPVITGISNDYPGSQTIGFTIPEGVAKAMLVACNKSSCTFTQIWSSAPTVPGQTFVTNDLVAPGKTFTYILAYSNSATSATSNTSSITKELLNTMGAPTPVLAVGSKRQSTVFNFGAMPYAGTLEWSTTSSFGAPSSVALTAGSTTKTLNAGAWVIGTTYYVRIRITSPAYTSTVITAKVTS